MTCRHRLALVLLISVWATIAAGALAAQTESPALATLKVQLEERREMVTGWAWDAKVVLGLAVATGLLGLAVTALQPVKTAKVTKVGSAVAGILVGAITVVKATVYEIDRGTLNAACHRARPHLEDADLKLQQELPAGFDDREAYIDSFRESLRAVDRIAAELDGKSSAEKTAARFSVDSLPIAAALGLFTQPAFAQDPEQVVPAWVREPPQLTGDAQFFTASGTSSSLGQARELSRKNAAGEAIRFFSSRIESSTPEAAGIDSKDFATFLAQDLEEVRSAFARDPQSGLYRYYTLVRVSAKELASGAALYGVRQNVSVPEEIGKNLMSLQTPVASYQLQRENLYATLLGEALTSFPEEDALLLQEARLRRMSGDSAGAKHDFEALVQRHPSSYLAWFNLGLANDNLGNHEKARAAYQKALALEPTLPVRDSSIYNTYGHFLYRLGENQASVEYFDKALAIMPDHPLAKPNRDAALAGLPVTAPAQGDN